MPHFRSALALILAALCAAAPVAALEGGSIDSNASATFAGAASLQRSGVGVYSAVLISPTVALTAAHVVAGVSPAQLTLQFNLDALAPAERTVAVERIDIAPGFVGFQGNGQIPFNDLAVLRLAAPAPAAVPIYDLYRSTLTTGTQITLVGYGGTGAGVKRQGTNAIDTLLPADPSGPAAAFAYDYDPGAGSEATVVGGDSGSPAFVQVGDRWQLAGINTFAWQGPTEPGVGGVRGGGGMIVSAYAGWIDQAILVPEPATWVLLAAGLALLAATRVRRARA